MLIAASSQKSPPTGRKARSFRTLLATSLVGAALLMPAPAFAEMRGGHSGGGHGGYRGGGGAMMGTGIAIGIIGAAIQQSAQRPPDVVQSQPRRASGKDGAKTRTKKKDVAKAKPVPVKQDAQHPANCEQCKPLAESIARYEAMLAEEKARLAAEERYKKRHEDQLAKFNRPFDDPMRRAWTEVIASSAAQIADIQALIAQIEAALKSRKDQLAAHTKPPEVASKPKDKEEQVASVPPRIPVVPVVGVPTSPGTSTPPSVSTPPSTPPSTPSQSGPPSTSPPTGTTTTRTTTTGTPPATPTGLTTTTPPTTSTSGGLSTTAKGPCEDHWAELSNGKRIFHRLYVVGTAKTKEERDKWLVVLKEVQDGFKAPNRQADGSTEKVLEEPTTAEFAQELQRLKDTVQPCEEVTLYLTAHGGGGVDYGQGTKTEGDAKAEYAVLKQKRNPETKAVESNELIDDVAFGKMVQGFKPNVSFTLIASSCYGGGFSGLNNIQEGKLVKVIGLYTQCTSSGTFEGAIRDGMNKFAEQNPDGRAMVNDIKDYLREKGWPLGVPMDDARDQYVQDNIKQYRPD